MSLIIETGSNVANAVSYASRAEVIAYAAARGVTVADASATDVFVIKAMDFIERQKFLGTPSYGVPGVDQALKFPRNDIWYEGAFLSGVLIPSMLKNAVCEAAMLYSQGVDLEPNRPTTQQSVKRDKVGPLETEYFEPETYAAYAPVLHAYLKPLISASFTLTAYRA